MRVMGLDIGTKRIGVAVSDETGTIATGREVVQRKSTEFAVGRIREIVEEYNVQKIVVGLPVNMDGTEGERADDSRRFAGRLEEETDLAVELWDERLSTKEAEDIMIKADTSRAKRKMVIDKIAAQIILQGYLDSSPGREGEDV
ncbi:MAG: Holliday junction resolvase RuvX [Candidatus Tantalella remota]|nr:Holliday junction resolvase RuvX [Candidatus Tantalella remota]